MIDLDELREKLAALEHERWSRWEKYRTKASNEYHHSGDWNENRWLRQSNTEYTDLSETEKDSDRVEANKTLAVVTPLLEEYRRALVFARSVIKGGESWSETCDREIDAVLSAGPQQGVEDGGT